jgi:NADPH-dependent 2,4-dienoyl-CoA reductase/sulfur reductase-like enzyme
MSAPHSNLRRFVIVGNGVAGFSAAETIRELDPGAELIILTDEPFAFYSRPGLAYMLNGSLPEKQLFPRSIEELKRLDIRTVYGRAIRIHPSHRVIHLAEGEPLTYDALLIATGAKAILPSIPGIELEGVVTFDTLHDGRRILQLTKKARRAVVVGGGVTALELAEGLAARRVKTHYLLRKDHFWGRVLSPAEAALVEDELQQQGIKLHRQTQVQKIVGKKGRVSEVVTDHGKSIRCEIVAVAIGIRPRIELGQSAGVEVDRGIMVDPWLRTSDPNIFAAGDVAQVFDPPSGEYRLDSLWWMAEEQGRIAGTNMAGGDETYQRAVPFNVTRIGGIVTTIIGAVGQAQPDDDLVSIVHGDSESWRDRLDSFAVESQSKHSRLRLVIGEETIVGAVIMGDQTLSEPIHELIRTRAKLGRYRDQFMKSPEQAMEILSDYASKQNGRHLATVK